jgi:diadenosine tetraphosphate (Ap4A) HIT family hydrolase
MQAAQISDKYNEFIIKDYNYWTLYIHENQCFLGRCYIVCKRDDAVDFFDMTNKEKEELFNVGKKLKKVLIDLFQPDLFNYASLGNIFTHLHLHVIPRYQKERKFNGIVFVDENWGKNYAPYNYDFKLDKDILFKLRDKLKLAL